MEEKSKFSFDFKKFTQNPEQLKRGAITAGVALVLLILAIVLGSVAGKASARKAAGNNGGAAEIKTTIPPATSVTLPPATTPQTPTGEQSPDDPAADPYPASDKYKAGKYVVVDTNGDGLNVRSAPSVDGDRIGHLEEGEDLNIIKVVEINDAGSESRRYWGQFKMDDGTFGYVSMAYLEAVN